MKKSIFSVVAIVAIAATLFTGCKDDVDPWGNVKSEIRTMNIMNGGLTGAEVIKGVVDQDAKTILFENVPAETDIAAIKFDGNFSLGAKLDTTVFDFTDYANPNARELTKELNITNWGDKHNTYMVTIRLAEPVSNPVLSQLIMRDADGNTFKAEINAEDSTVCFNMKGKGTAYLESITLIPARTAYTFTAMDGDVLKEDNAGDLELDFLGKKMMFHLSFARAAAAGVNYNGAIVHDFSVATGSTYSYFTGETTRGSDFDGEYVLIVSRSDAATPTPHLLKVSDLLKGDASKPIMLNVTGVEGGTHVVSAGRLSRGHVYICNLATPMGPEAPLKVYHWTTAQPDVAPEVVLTFDNTIDGETASASLRGDNISINLDESGNGYAFFFPQGNADCIIRFTITGFTNFSNPTKFPLTFDISYYGYMNELPDEPGKYVMTSSYCSSVKLMDADANELSTVAFSMATLGGEYLMHGVDPRVIMFNRARYLMFTVSNMSSSHWNFGPKFYMLDMTEGVGAVGAMATLNNKAAGDDWEPDYSYALVDTEAGVGVTAPTAQTNAAVIDDKLVVYTASNNVGFALIEFPKAE